ncbi:MAG: acyl-CoA thioesterase [Caldilineaceae bacterium]|nr:acyl-CoA thioesterase [Caldilineaceae bacterium]
MSDSIQKLRTVADSALTLTQYMQPEHSNSLGSVHGGVLLKLCDECGGIIASRHSRRTCVTVTVDSVTFHLPALVGQLVLVHGRLTYVGRTSMEVELHVEAEDLLTGEITHTNSAYFVYVAVDRSLRPTPVPGLQILTDDERRRFDEGSARQALRLERARGQAGDGSRSQSR